MKCDDDGDDGVTCDDDDGRDRRGEGVTCDDDGRVRRGEEVA